MESEQDPMWICAACGTRHHSKERPCRNCASEQFARLEESDTRRVQSSGDVTWICTGCGQKSPRNNTPCRNCGGFDYSRVRDTPADTTPTGVDQTQPDSEGTRRISMAFLMAYGFGALALLSVIGALSVGSTWSFLSHAFAAAVAMPYSRSRMERAFGVEFTTPAVVALSVGAYVTGNLLILPHL